MKTIEFEVYGTPKPAGSKRGFPVRRKGGGIGVAIVDSSGTAGREWRALVQDRARAAMGSAPVLLGPLRLSVTFRLCRPKGHHRARPDAAGAPQVKPTAPRFPATKPDATKLLRAVEDALTGIVWGDDAQVVVQHVYKQFAAPGTSPCALVMVAEEVEG